MRENRPYGSEGGESGPTGLPYPYLKNGQECPCYSKTDRSARSTKKRTKPTFHEVEVAVLAKNLT